MPKTTLAFLIFLSVLASLLLGINIGKKLGISQNPSQSQPAPSVSAIPTEPLSPTPEFNSGYSQYRDQACGFEFSYSGLLKETQNEIYKSAMIANPANEAEFLIATCQEEIPKPPLTEARIEDITLDGVPTKLYHDASQNDGSPRDEIIVKHPTRNLEIIVAGFGTPFSQAISSFKFIP